MSLWLRIAKMNLQTMRKSGRSTSIPPYLVSKKILDEKVRPTGAELRSC